MTLQKIIEEASQSHVFWIVVTMTLIQIAPIKIDPWSFVWKMIKKFFCWLSRVSLAPVLKKMDEIDTKVDTALSKIDTIEKESEIKNANDWRWDILDFFNSARNGRRHSKEEWDHVIDQIKKYERHVEIHGIDNGVLEEASKWLRAEYQEHLRKNDFLDTKTGDEK